MSPEFTVDDYLNEQLSSPEAVNTESLQALLNKKTSEFELLKKQVYIYIALFQLSFYLNRKYYF